MKLKDLFKSQVLLQSAGWLALSISMSSNAQSVISTLKEKFHLGSTPTNYASTSTNASSKLKTTQTVHTTSINTNRVNMKEVAVEDTRSAATKQLGTISEPEKSTLNESTYSSSNFFGSFNSYDSDRVFNALEKRLSGGAKRPLEFRGRSTAGHEFKIVILMLPVDNSAPPFVIDPQKDYMLDIAVYFDGADSAPLRGRLYPTFSGLNTVGALFTGMLMAAETPRSQFQALDLTSDLSMVIDFNVQVNKFELKQFSLKATALTANPFQDSNETIATGGLDSGGGK